MKSQIIIITQRIWILVQKFGARLLEATDTLLDDALAKLAGKDHSLGAKFAKESTILSSNHKGFVLTGTKAISPELSYMGVLVNGGSGSGKSTVVALPNCLTTHNSKIVHDPSGELYLQSSGFLKSQGYTIIRIDWASAKKSERYNPLARAHTLSDYSKLATQLVGASSDKKDSFWDAMAIQLLVCVIRIVKLLPQDHQTLAEAARIIDLLQSKTGQGEVDQLVASLAEQDTGLFEKYAALISNSENTLSGILASASTAVSMLVLDENIIQIISSDTLGDFRQWRKQKTVVYLHSSTVNMRYYSKLSSLFLQQYFEVLFESLPESDDNSVDFILDEAPLLSIELDVLAANVRKYRGSLMLICQDSEAQLTATYGRERAQSILSNLKTKIFLSASLHLAQSLSKELGSYEYEDSKTKHKRERALLTADEIMTLPQDRGIITVSGQGPILARLKPFYKIPEWTERAALAAIEGSSNQKGIQLLPSLLNISEYLQKRNQETSL
jgi:type IV secretory pathway TraG/TraD family ATPase VirD4